MDLSHAGLWLTSVLTGIAWWRRVQQRALQQDALTLRLRSPVTALIVRPLDTVQRLF